MTTTVNLQGATIKGIQSLCSEKKCQGTKFIHMLPLKAGMKKSSYMQLPKPAKEEANPDDKNCQSTRSYKKMCLVRPGCNDKNCQSANNICYDIKY